jgi:uncharacterized protein YndB with AHSA1/START domain
VKRDLKFEAVYPNRLEEVWHALTDSGSLADWLMENDFKPLPGHKFHFRLKSRFGIERLIPCEVLVVDEPRLLSWNWGDEGSVVTFRLEAITGGTRLILDHTGLKGMRGLALAWVLSHGWARKIDRRLPAVLACAASEQTRYEDRLRH